MTTPAAAVKKRITMDRRYEDASVDDVWDLWTTREGLESWWGPEGFVVEVMKLELRAGGELFYAMKCVAPEQVEFMKKAGMPLVIETRITFTEITPKSRLAYVNHADFMPGVEPYDVATVVEIAPLQTGGVHMVLAFDAMHDEMWTQRAAAGWESELGKLDKLLASRKTK